MVLITHFPDKATEAWRGETNGPRSQFRVETAELYFL